MSRTMIFRGSRHPGKSRLATGPGSTPVCSMRLSMSVCPSASGPTKKTPAKTTSNTNPVRFNPVPLAFVPLARYHLLQVFENTVVE